MRRKIVNHKDTMKRSYFDNYVKKFNKEFLAKSYLSDLEPYSNRRRLIIGVNNDETTTYDKKRTGYHLVRFISDLNEIFSDFKNGLPIEVEAPIPSSIFKDEKRFYSASFNMNVWFLLNSQKATVDIHKDIKREKYKVFFLPFKSLVDIYSQKPTDPIMITFDEIYEYLPDLFKSDSEKNIFSL